MPPPEGVRFQFRAVMKRRDDLVMKVNLAGDYLDQPFADERFQRYTEEVRKLFSLKQELKKGIMDVAAPYYGRPLREPELEELTWRLAASYDLLQQGGSGQARFVLSQPEWVPLLIEDCAYTSPSQSGKTRISVTFRLLGGRFAGLRFSQALNHVYLTRVLAPEIGFPRFSSLHHGELVQCWLGSEFNVPEPERPAIQDVYGTSVAIEHNRQLRKIRDEPCPKGYDWACHKCPVGYEYPDGCPRATHTKTFVRRPCEECRSEKAYFDPSRNDKRCVVCNARMLRGRLNIERHM